MATQQRKYQRCTRCIMDTTASDIIFDENGMCNYCSDYFKLLQKHEYMGERRNELLQKKIEKIKREGRHRDYDCIAGLSGGADSSYALYITVKLGLRPLAVHLDNGWNSELAVNNIEKLCSGLKVDLHTHVIDWEEFKELQKAFFKANVVDIELLTDHAIITLLYELANKHKVKYILAGSNLVTEGIVMPSTWGHDKKDKRNIKGIYKRFGNGRKLKTFPMMGFFNHLRYNYLKRIEWVPFLDYVDYHKAEAIQILSREIGWRPYEKKHYESIFTRFYQGHILPLKFNVDKRKIHFSTLICSGQMTLEEALALMEQEPYDNALLLQDDMKYVGKKLGFTNEEMENYLDAPIVPHAHYPSSVGAYHFLSGVKRSIPGFLKPYLKKVFPG